MTGITAEQYRFLTAKLADNRVSQLKGNSHVEAWDDRRHLIRIFGFGGWDSEIIECTLVSEDGVEKNGRIGWTVVYRVLCRLIVKDPAGNVIARYEDGACGDASNLPSRGDAHDFALKTALSQALKRCAVNLGDQFGLSLYNGGSTSAVVLRSLVVPEGVAVAAPPTDDAPVQPEPGAPAVDQEPSSQAAAGPEPAAAERPSPSQRAVKIFAAITDSVDLPGLENVRAQIHLAVDMREVSDTEAKQLELHYGKRRGELEAVDRAHPTRMSTQQRAKIFAQLGQAEMANDRERALAYINEIIAPATVESTKELTKAQASKVIDRLDNYLKTLNPPDGVAA